MANARRDAEIGATLTGIRNPKAYADAQWDLGIFLPAFEGTRIKPTDVDGLIHTGRGTEAEPDRFSYLEFKGVGAPVDIGQRITMGGLVRAGFNVLVIEGPRNEPRFLTVWKTGVRTPITLEELNARLRAYHQIEERLHG